MRFSEDFDAIYIRYSDQLYRYIYTSVKDAYLAEDLTGEVFLRVWKKWKEIKQDFIQALLYKTAKNIIIDYYRSRKNKKNVSLEETVEMGLEPSYDEDLIEKINKDTNIQMITGAMSKLPENLKEVLVLRFVNDLSAKEAGEILNISEGNVRVLQYRALNKLKEVLKNGK